MAWLSLILYVRDRTKVADGAAFAILVNSRICFRTAHFETWCSTETVEMPGGFGPGLLVLNSAENKKSLI